MPLTVCWFSKIQIGFAFLVPAHPGSPGQRAVKRVCVCVWRWHYQATSHAWPVATDVAWSGLSVCQSQPGAVLNGWYDLNTIQEWTRGDPGIRWALRSPTGRGNSLRAVTTITVATHYYCCYYYHYDCCCLHHDILVNLSPASLQQAECSVMNTLHLGSTLVTVRLASYNNNQHRTTFKNIFSHSLALLLIAGIQILRDFTGPNNVTQTEQLTIGRFRRIWNAHFKIATNIQFISILLLQCCNLR